MPLAARKPPAIIAVGSAPVVPGGWGGVPFTLLLGVGVGVAPADVPQGSVAEMVTCAAFVEVVIDAARHAAPELT